MVILSMKFKHKRHNLLHFILELVKVDQEVGLELVRQFYIRQDLQQRCLVRD
jgi:hypothetical protein